MALTDNLVSYWKFDESSGNAADSVRSNTLTNTNSASFVTGKIGNGVDVEKDSSQYFKIDDGSQSGLDITGDMSIVGWYKPESLPSGAYAMTPLVSKWVSTSNQRAFRFGISQDASNVTSLGLNHSGNGSTSTNNYVNYAFSTGTWYFIGMVYDASAGSVEFYVHGSSIGTVSSLATSTYNSSAQFEIGGNAQQSEYADGIIDEVGVWARTLSSTEISALYNSGNGLSYSFSSVSTIFKDNFTGSTINTSIWNETDTDGVISQNNVLNLDCEASTNRALFYNKLQSVATITSGVACVQGNLTWTTNSTNEPQAGIFLYVDDNNYAAITTRSTPGGQYRCVINTGGGGFEYSVEPGISKGKDVKITYDIGATSIKFWYWNGSAWVQMGTTQTYNIGSTVYCCISGVIGTTPADGVDPLIVDDAYFFETDTSDHYPPDPPVTLNTTNFFF